MDLLPVNFYVLRFCGVWKEHKNSNLIIRFINFCHRNDVEDLTESLFLVLTFMCLCLKYLNVLMRQCELRALLDCFRANLCQPRNSMEKSILKQYDLKGT
ncbi:hypothetical protein ALC57_00381 [Trachymyrmex cornetzi]|uniref:Uncharacterized protein n=1 Tax=Trachymyrmex cornetzi TaxID=471704 RepID=A0A151JSE9_9HYME|nr:hypothetical protein ALC57_00381 [Trachymyrmex cornetzi]